MNENSVKVQCEYKKKGGRGMNEWTDVLLDTCIIFVIYIYFNVIDLYSKIKHCNVGILLNRTRDDNW